MVTKKILHMQEDGTVRETDIGALAENVTFEDKKTLPEKLSRLDGYIGGIKVPSYTGENWSQEKAFYTINLDLDYFSFPNKFTEDTLLDVDIDLSKMTDENLLQQALKDYAKLRRVVVGNDTLRLESNDIIRNDFYIKIKGVGLRGRIDDWENRSIEDWEASI
ncbi:MAG: hypothetical protein Q4D90_02470 [bacterium]|nr:hypothetical protein [bacterium]